MNLLYDVMSLVVNREMEIYKMKLFQNLINQIREILDKEFGIIDETGLVLACSDDSKVGLTQPLISKINDSRDTVIVIDGITFQKVFIKSKLEFICYIKDTGSQANICLSLISINAVNIKTYFEDKFDRNNFIKSVILDNVLPGDIQLRAKELHIANTAYRVVFLIKIQKTKEIYSHEVIQSLFPNRAKDFVVILDDESIVLVKELKNDDDSKEIERTSRSIIDTLNTESMVNAVIGIGTIVDSIRDIARSFKEAQTAIEVGGIFDSDRSIISYNKLGIGRLIYQLPTTLCKLFLKEVFADGTYESLDAETLLTIQKFFDNNLNVSETSRQLYVHRNTLVYRLDKIEKITGLDLRKFDDAIIFKVSMLVKKYLDKFDKMI